MTRLAFASHSEDGFQPGRAARGAGRDVRPGGRGPRFDARMGRVVACPGETVALRDGVVYVDGAREIFSPAVGAEADSSRTGSDSTSFEPTLLGEDEFFVIGDNRSADTGMVVKKEQILGRYPQLRLALHRASVPTILRLGHDED